MKRLFLSITTLCLCLIAGAQSRPAYLDPSRPIEERIDDALSRMTLEEKVRLCHAQGKFYSNGVPRLGIPGLWSSDGPHGVRFEMQWAGWGHAGWETDSCTAFPSLTCLAATWNEELAYQYGHGVGEEARYRNKHVMLGPGVNIYRTPLNGRNFEYMGEDPYLTSRMCVPYIKGVQSMGVASCVKHFCLNNQENNRMAVNVEVSERALREIYLPAFKAAVEEAGVWSLMGAYNKVRGTHACHNHYTLQEILKGEWGFDGAVLSDWDGTHNAREAAYNGLDIEMGTSNRPDTGISGRTAQKVSEKLAYIAGSHQVLCITHLPQIAAMADNHYRISKGVQAGKTTTEIEELSGREMLEELARLLGGVTITEAVMENAGEMKKMAEERKQALRT